MKQFNIISSILDDPWAIDEKAAHALSPMVASLFTPNLVFEAGKPILPTSSLVIIGAGPSADASLALSTARESKNIRVISLNGVMTKQDQMCGPVGTIQICQWIREAREDSSVDGVVFKTCTPGGEVHGTEELGNEIEACNKIKPVVGFAEDQTCSAGLWAISPCVEVWANNTTAQIGSIGVLMSFMDVQPYYESMGVKFHTITANQSSEKTKLYEDLRAGKYDEYRKTVLDPLAQKFIDTIKANRPAATDEKFYKGKVFFARDVVGTLIDGICTFDQALQRCAELASEHTSGSTNNPDNTMIQPNLTRFAAASKMGAIESNAEGTISLTVAAVQAVEAALEKAETDAAAKALLLSAANATITTNATDATTASQAAAAQALLLTASEASVVDLTAQVVALGAEPGAKTAIITSETDKTIGGQEDNYHTRYARVSEMLKD